MTMEAVAVAVAPQPATNNTETQKKNRIQVSNTKKPLFFYVNLAKRYIQQHNEVELSALGMAITTVVTVAEILKNNGFATEKSKYFLSLSSFYPANLSFFITNKKKVKTSNAYKWSRGFNIHSWNERRSKRPHGSESEGKIQKILVLFCVFFFSFLFFFKLTFAISD
ncbi:PREDICTED: uncharacterized protein LOC109191048 isoform X1 [Ipomoea nil]|uniref:uncharacterized protein LOC109191048 isoform X1 n=1 Tax=Ipomoea nil TaxID=35883 RepID=UPI000900E423|nr:PREDICTED: uncharacterized protein LOC109191048 isoform X1 [Ipomoea nil]